MRLTDQARAAADAILALPQSARVRVLARTDVDGLASAAIAMRALRMLRRTFHITYTDRVGGPLLAHLEQEPDEATLFLGLGHAFLENLHAVPGRLLVFDDGPVQARNPDPTRIHHVNARREPGDAGASASIGTFAWASALDPTHESLAALALLGAWSAGAPLDVPGAVADAAALATKNKSVRIDPGLALPDDPLIDVVAALPAPWDAAFRDVADRLAFLAENGLAPEANLHELDAPDLEHFASLLVTRGLRRGVDAQRVADLVRPTPRLLTPHGLPFPRIMTLIEAAASQGEAALGLAFLLGDPSVRDELEALATKQHAPHHEAAHGHPKEAHA